MSATIGRIVHYTLTQDDADEIVRRRHETPARTGNFPHAGDVFPAMIVRVWGTAPNQTVQLQVFLDGNDTHWALSIPEGEGPGSWAWPPRA